MGGLRAGRVLRRLLSLPELTARFTELTGGGTTPPGVTVSTGSWRVARADSPQDQHLWMAGLNTPAAVPSPGCVDVRVQITATGGTFGPTTLLPTWNQDGMGPFGFLGNSPDVGTLRLGSSLRTENTTPTINLLNSPTFVPGSYLTATPTDPFTPITLTAGQTTELVVTVCPKAGLAPPTYFELCFAEASGAAISCPNPPKVIIGGGLAWFKG